MAYERKRWLNLKGHICPICNQQRGSKQHTDKCSREAQRLYGKASEGKR